ncbi:MAG: dockerin type I repeat-containing protein [bacterium]
MKLSKLTQTIATGFMFLLAMGTFAEDTLPEWTIGSWWDFTTSMDVHMQQEGSTDYFDMVITDQATRHTLQSIERKTLTHGTQLTYDVCVLPFSGTVNANGIYQMRDPIPLALPVEIRNATLTGEWWVDVDSLGTVYQLRDLSGPLWAEIPYVGWQQIGSFAITLHEEYEPMRDAVNFPVETGNAWQSNFTLYTFGEYVLSADLFGEPTYEEAPFDKSYGITLNMSVPKQELFGGLLVYVIEGQSSSGTGSTLSRYAPDARTLVYDYLEGFVSQGEFQINSYERTMNNFHLNPGQEPTSTPEPDCINDGDVNQDRRITSADAQLAFLIVLGQFSPTHKEECAADCNGDDRVTSEDAQLIFLTTLGSASCVHPLP